MSTVEENASSHPEDAKKIDLIALLGTCWKVFRQSWWLCVLLVVLLGGFGYFRTVRSYTPQYTATASFVVTTGSASGSISTSAYYNRASAKQINATFPYILSSGSLNKLIMEQLGTTYIPGYVTASMVGNTNVVQFKSVAGDAQTAYDLLCAVVDNYPTVARHIIGNTSLKLLEETGVPAVPSNVCDPWSGAVKWGILGIGLYLAVLLILAFCRRTVRNEEDLKTFLNVKYLGSLPHVQFKRRSSQKSNVILLDNPGLPGYYASAMETLQLRVARSLQSSGRKTLLVTSALMGEGKTTTACNLAMLLADKGSKVLLIDGDLRKPTVAKTLRQAQFAKVPGLRQYLDGSRRDASELIQQYNDTSLYVLPAGGSASDVSSLFTNGRLEALLNELRPQMDYIIIDTPPCAGMHDASLMASCFDSGLLVIRQDYAHTSQIIASAENLAEAGLPLVGCVINGDSAGHSSYGYHYYGKYGYGNYGYGSYRK